jgi:hypothetical protein
MLLAHAAADELMSDENILIEPCFLLYFMLVIRFSY